MQKVLQDERNRDPDYWLFGFNGNKAHMVQNPTHMLDSLDPVLDFMF